MNRDKLERLVIEGKTQRQLAHIFQCSQTNVKYWLKKFELSTARETKEVFCAECNKELVNRRSQYCSRECAAKSRWKKETLPRVLAGTAGPCAAKSYLLRQSHSCSECNQGDEWNGKPITLQLDHKDGDSDNNNLSNLRILCPNCHSQTDNYGSKNKGQRSKRNKYMTQYRNPPEAQLDEQFPTKEQVVSSNLTRGSMPDKH